MTSSVPPGVFGLALSLFVILLAIATWRFPQSRRLRLAAFLGMFLYSFAFVLFFLTTQRKAEQQFVEVGYYYPLNPSSSSSPSRSDYTLRMGTLASQSNYVVDLPCKTEPCFSGYVDFFFEQRASGANRLTWQKSSDFDGAAIVVQPRETLLGRIADLFGPARRVSENGATGIELPGSKNNFVVLWTPSRGGSSSVPLAQVTVDLTPPDAPPRLIVENVTPPIVELPNQRNLGSSVEAFNNLPATIHLTSSNQAIALRFPGRSGYVPTIKVGKNAPGITVNAFLERQDQNGGEDLILNDGLRRIDNPLGHRFYVGTDSGLVATVTSRGGAQWKAITTACIGIWLLPLFFFLPTLLQREGRVMNFGVYLLLVAIQMLLAVRVVLGARAYFWEPYSRAALETAFFAALLIPLLLFMGLHAAGLNKIGESRDKDGWRKSWWRYLLTGFPPFAYWLLSLGVLIALYSLMRVSGQVVADASVLAFQNFRDSKTSFLILLVLPPLTWAIALLLDRRLRGGRDSSGVGLSLWDQWKVNYGARRILYLPLFPFVAVTSLVYRKSRRDNTYVGGGADPISYSMLKTETSLEQEHRKWPRRARSWLLFIVVAVILLLMFYQLGESGFIVWRILAGVTAFVLGVSLRRLSLFLRPVNFTAAVAARSLGNVAWIVSGLTIAKAVLRAIGFSTASEALLPGVPLRTTFFFEILTLILSMRVLAAFFSRWRDAETPFRMGELTVVYVTPMFMLLLSVVASRDTGAVLVHGPAFIGATILITGLWPLWKRASGWGAAIWAAVFPLLLLGAYYLVILTTALSFVISDPHKTINHRVLLREGTDVALAQAETGGPRLLGAIEQNWRMMNYAAEGGWLGKGYGNARIPASGRFRNISMDDLVFSVYLLSEEGAVAGLALLALYFVIFLLILRIAWTNLRDEPLRVALAGGLCLMLVFPAMYMAAANVNQLIFTGQNLPLLNLRSHSEIVRTGIVLMLLLAALKPLSVVAQTEEAAASSRLERSWFQLLRPIPGLVWQLVRRDGRRLKAARLDDLAYDSWAVAAVVASNLLLIGLLLSLFFIFPIAGMVHAANNSEYKEELDLKFLKDRAAEYIKNRQIWYEPVPAGGVPGKACAGGNARNRPTQGGDQTRLYQLCMDSNVKGGAEGDTFSHLIGEWNGRKEHRGNGAPAEQKYDASQFFQLELAAINPRRTNVDPTEIPLSVNRSVYRWASPFRPLIRWSGALTEANALASNGGVLVGANLQLPLRAGTPGEPVFVGVDPGHVHVNLDEVRQFQSERGFAIFEKAGEARPIFAIDTISDAVGARLVPVSGDFDLFLNGCRLLVGNDCGATETAYRGSAPPIRLDDGDVIAYAARDKTGRRVPRHVFVYSQAQLGSFSHLAWANGKFDRFYPQGASWPMAQQITSSISSVTESDSPRATEDVRLTIDADLNNEVYGLLRRWRGCLEGNTPADRCCIDGDGPNDQCHRTGAAPRVAPVQIDRRSSRRMAVTLMDTETGALLALASDDGTPTDPNAENPNGIEVNLNLQRHRIGSAIKPFTASATLRSFSDLHNLTIVDQRRDKKRLLGLPFDGKKELAGHVLNAEGAIGWGDFLTRSDNLYAATLTLLGMCRSDGRSGLPSFESASSPQSPLRLVLTDNATTLGSPVWAFPNIFQTESDGNWRSIDLLDKTPLAQQLKALFDVRVVEPQVASFATDLWLPVTTPDQLSKQDAFNTVSPEITNFAFPDILNYSDLRSVVLGGEFGDPSLTDYGRIGSAWSNVFLAQSFARLTTGRKVTASIVSVNQPQANAAPVSAWFENAQGAPWRIAMLHELEGVVVEPYGTAHNAVAATLGRIAGVYGQHAVRSGRTVFTIVSKTGTLDPDAEGYLLEDSNYIFTAGIWNDQTGQFERAVTGAVYIEQGTEGQAQAFAAALLSLINHKARFQWNQNS